MQNDTSYHAMSYIQLLSLNMTDNMWPPVCHQEGENTILGKKSTEKSNTALQHKYWLHKVEQQTQGKSRPECFKITRHLTTLFSYNLNTIHSKHFFKISPQRKRLCCCCCKEKICIFSTVSALSDMVHLLCLLTFRCRNLYHYHDFQLQFRGHASYYSETGP